LIAGVVLAIFLAYLFMEHLRLQRKVDAIPLRICVTGTRGKSSVTRLIAAAMRESGKSVLARTTGAKPILIFPDGRESETRRRGLPTILEGKKVLRAGAELRVDVCVVELMSIHPEAIYVESQMIFKPHILVLTNVRLDHMDQMGKTKDDIASCFAGAIPKAGTVIVLQKEIYPVFQRIADSRKTKVLGIPETRYQEYLDRDKGILNSEFNENVCLSLAVTEHLGLDNAAASRAMCGAMSDFGSLKVWFDLEDFPLPEWYFVSAFAANEPESTRSVFSKLKARMLLEDRTVIGVLNLRGDRGDRTLQWYDALRNGEFPEIQKLVCVGDHVSAMTRKLKKCKGPELFAWRNYRPEEMLERLSTIEDGKAVVIGLGNMGGAGKRLVDFWEKTGKRYDL
jgi:poly-gamma-glutamate synthase PgsB/CapB